MTRRARHTCPAKGCGVAIERWMRLCNHCFKSLPVDHQRAMASARSSGRVLALADATRAAVAWLADHSPAAIAARQLGEAPP